MLNLLLASVTSLAVTSVAPVDPAEKAVEVADRGIEFLLDQQQPDGTWQAAPQVPPAYTALATRALLGSDDFGPDSPEIKRALDSLLDQQTPDGGVYSDLLANYNTAIAVSTFVAASEEAGDDRFDQAIVDGVNFIRRLQWLPEIEPEFEGDRPEGIGNVADQGDPFYGGWGYGGRSRGDGRPDLSNLSMALEALHDADIPADDPAYRAALTFITRLQNNSETNPNDWAGDDGGFVYSPDADGSYESFAGEYIDANGQRRLRSYGSMTYAGLKSMIYAGLSKDDPRVVAAHDWVQNNWTLDENPGMAEGDPDKARWGHFYYLITLARALDAYDEPMLDTPTMGEIDWRIELINAAAEMQNPDGSWQGESKWQEDQKVLVTSYVVNALNTARKDLAENPPTLEE
jgi:squalene-hopene/tetraprenyl-beta-curcumene cyclase